MAFRLLGQFYRRLVLRYPLLLFFLVIVLTMIICFSKLPQYNDPTENEIPYLNKDYMRTLAQKTNKIVDGPHDNKFTTSDLKRTIAVLLEMLNKMSRMEAVLNYIMQNQTLAVKALKMYQVTVIKEGYNVCEGAETKASATVTLVNGPHKIIVDTGNPWDKEDIVQGLAKHSLLPSDIDYVVCTHGHVDHVGNLNLFTHAIFIVSYDICIRNRYLHHDFKEGIPYEIDDWVEVIATPGHTGEDVSVIVKETTLGVVAITGDLFECQEDLEKPHLWQQQSQKPESQEQYRADILKEADYIIPGHGPMFQVPEAYKKQIQMVLLNE